MSFSGYQIRGDVLSTMKEAAGNYMPDYGNWRYKLAQPPPEPTTEIEVDPEPEYDESSIDFGEVTEGETIITPETVEIKKYEGRKATDGVVGEDGYEQWQKDEYDKYIAHTQKADYIPWADKPENQTIIPASESTSEGSDTRGNQHDRWEVYPKGHAKAGQEIPGTRVTKLTGDQSANPNAANPITKRGHVESPMQSRGAMPPTEQEVPQNPYADVDKFLAKQINLYDINGAVATKDIHDHVKIIMGDVKENVFFKKGKDSKETKNNKHEAATIVDSMHKSFQEDLSGDGTVDTFVQMSKENTISDSITDQEKFVFASMAHLKGVKPAIDENNHMVYPIPMPTGETFPVTNQWMTETIKKRTKPYAFATEFNKNKGAFFDAGRSGHPWDKDTIIMQNKKSIAANPDQLAALYIDKGLLHPDAFVDLTFEKEDQDEASPYTKSMGDNFSNKQFILNAIGDPETRKELEDNLADGMEKIAFATYNRGKAEYDKENKKNKPTAGMSLEEKKKFYQNSTNIA